MRVALGLSGVVVVLGAWQILSWAGVISPLSGSSPVGVWQAGIELINAKQLQPALLSTGKLFGLGFGLSLVSGLLVGMLIGWYRVAGALLDPWVSILYAMPRIAFIPIIIIWAGIGENAQVIVVWSIAAFPIIINTAVGISTVDRDHIRVAQSFLATKRDVLFTIALPGAVPAILAGVRQGMVQGLIGVVVAEYFIGNQGVGGLIFNAGETLQTGEALFGALVFAAAALILTAVLRLIERRLDKWRA